MDAPHDLNLVINIFTKVWFVLEVFYNLAFLEGISSFRCLQKSTSFLFTFKRETIERLVMERLFMSGHYYYRHMVFGLPCVGEMGESFISKCKTHQPLVD